MVGFGSRGNTPNKKPDASKPPKGIELCFRLLKSGDLIRAQKICSQLVLKHPTNGLTVGLLATIEKNLGHLAEAARLFESAIELDPGNPDLIHNYSGLLAQLGDIKKALRYAECAHKSRPAHAGSLERYGYLLWQAGYLVQGLEITQKAILLNPKLVDAHLNLAGILKDLNRDDEAVYEMQRFLEMDPGNARAQAGLAGLLKDLDELDQAEVMALKAISTNPRLADAHYQMGTIQRAKGNLQAASDSLEYSLQLDPSLACAVYELSMDLRSIEAASALLARAEELAFKKPGPKSLLNLRAAQANCEHKLGKFDSAAKNLAEANAIKLQLYPSDLSETLSLIRTLASHSVYFAQAKEALARIFIVGMPRSGSTLLASILAMNESAVDLGETRAMFKAWRDIEAQQQTEPIFLDNIYRQHLPVVSPECQVTIDKQLYNFMHAGTIAAGMPTSKIIHIRRNPLDNILSFMRANLHPGFGRRSFQEFTEVLVAQESAMKAYKSRFPEHIYTVNYDTLVNYPRAEIGALIDWLGWNWSDHYLDHHTSTRRINTASVLEARKPISSKSVGSWKRYSSMLKTTRELLIRSRLFDTDDLEIDE